MESIASRMFAVAQRKRAFEIDMNYAIEVAKCLAIVIKQAELGFFWTIVQNMTEECRLRLVHHGFQVALFNANEWIISWQQ